MTAWSYDHIAPAEWTLHSDDSSGHRVDACIVLDERGVRGQRRDANPIWGGVANSTPQPLRDFAEHGPADTLSKYGTPEQLARIRAYVLLARKDELGQNDLRAALHTIAFALHGIGDAHHAVQDGAESEQQRADSTSVLEQERDGPLSSQLRLVLPSLFESQSFERSWSALLQDVRALIEESGP